MHFDENHNVYYDIGDQVMLKSRAKLEEIWKTNKLKYTKTYSVHEVIVHFKYRVYTVCTPSKSLWFKISKDGVHYTRDIDGCELILDKLFEIAKPWPENPLDEVF